MTKNLTQKAILEHLGLSKTRFYELKREIPEFSTAADLDTLRHAYIAHLRTVATGGKALHGEFSKGKDSINADYERSRLLREQADWQAMKNRARSGELAPLDEVRDLWQKMLMRFRARVLQLPSKALPLLAASQNQAQAKDILERCVHECLTELSELDASKIENVADAVEEEP